ncbi:hypothetical protein BDP27DRAFT_1320313 [Rhodocollybia butyracea]|uniref:F-box domain-containing protein n=1 Tax=Rhodocollybia butyracea TaxID=206335 RepID=A0A9P5UA32_9AGAR|nr:hypothetical protein BDP27DRAFT_1320313 [Rhodocollybia butyracea]
MGLLPLTAQDLVIRELSPQDRLYYSLINRECYEIVSSFNRRAFRVEKVLLRFFNQSEIDQFRMIQYHTGTLISGSTALQFFDLTIYEDSDLDLYVDIRYCSPLGKFLLRIGYQFQPFKYQKSKFDEALAEAVSHDIDVRIRRSEDQESRETWEYETRGIASVFNFIRDGRMVQVIVSERCAMDVILAFHSTCVINIISASHAYSLYPRATFIDRVALRNLRFRSTQARHDAAREKYGQRGWAMVGSPFASRALYRCSEFADTRCVGDSACWAIKLATPVQVTYGADPVRINSWTNYLHGYEDSLVLVQDNKTLEGFQYNYCVSPLINWSDFIRRFELLDMLEVTREEEHIDREWASWFSFLVNQNLRIHNDPITEKIRLRLIKLYRYGVPSFKEHPDVSRYRFPNALTASALWRQLVALHIMVDGDLTYEFGFRVTDTAKHVWTNVKVTSPSVHLFDASAIYNIVKDLKGRRVSLTIEGC